MVVWFSSRFIMVTHKTISVSIRVNAVTIGRPTSVTRCVIKEL